MATLTVAAGLEAGKRNTAAIFRQHAYLANGWGPLRRWDGRDTSILDAGITGPSRVIDSWTPTPTQGGGGSITAGVHGVRYRYLDSDTGYVSNPSEEREFDADGSKDAQFTVQANGGGDATKIERSADSKVDRIVIEMTLAGGTAWFKAGEFDQTDATMTVDISDAALSQESLFWPSEGHDPPPVSKYVVSHRGRLWCFGSVTHTTGTVAVTNGSATVTGTSTAWTTAALGTSGSPPKFGRAFIRIGSDTDWYEIDFAASATSLTLVENYGGSTDSGLAYEIVWRSNNVYFKRCIR